jgi:hypothetical protein
MNSTASIYIPRMSTRWTESGVKKIMAKYYIGTVSHVDFVPIDKKPGFVENTDNMSVMSAFVHFSISYDKSFWDSAHFSRSHDKSFWNSIENDIQLRLWVDTNEYWVCLKNKNPVKRTLMNIHQVVENGRHLESLVTSQAEEIKNLKETVAGLTSKIDCMHFALSKLLNGLYCQHTQMDALNDHLQEIGLEHSVEPDYRDTHPSGIWPTTRQGDRNQKRIDELEEKLKNLEDDLSTYGVL